MEIRFRLSGTIEVPDGSVIEGERCIRFPDGQWVKLWTAVELNDDRDLDFKEMQIIGIDIDDSRAQLESDEETV